MKHLVLVILLVVITSSAQANNAAAPQDTIVTKVETTREINPLTNDTIITIKTVEEIRKTVEKPDESYIINEENKKVNFIWERTKDKKKAHAHWSGFGMSFMGYNDKNIPDGAIKMGSSYNFTFNFISYAERLGHSNFMLVTGIGSDWAKYKFDDNSALTKTDRAPQFVPAPEGVNYISSKLTAYYITLPLMLEFQTSSFHFAAGALCMFKWHSKSQTRYYDENGGRHKETQGNDMVRPVDLRLKGQIGVNNVSLYGYYAPMSLFQSNNAPKVRTYSIGVMLHFN